MPFRVVEQTCLLGGVMKRTYIVSRHPVYHKTVVSVDEQKTVMVKSTDKKQTEYKMSALVSDEWRL
mgnify:CR=1 FL=1